MKIMYFIPILFITIYVSTASPQEANHSHHNNTEGEGEHYIESPFIEIPHTTLNIPLEIFQSDEQGRPMIRIKGDLPKPVRHIDNPLRGSRILNVHKNFVNSVYTRINFGTFIGSNIDIASTDQRQVFYSTGQFDNRSLGIAVGKYVGSGIDGWDHSFDHDYDDRLYEFEFRLTPRSMSSLEAQQPLKDLIRDRHPQQPFHPSNGTWSELAFSGNFFVNAFEGKTGSNIDTYFALGLGLGYLRMEPSPELLGLGFQPDTLIRLLPMVGFETDFFHNNPVGFRVGFRLYFPEFGDSEDFEFYRDGDDILLATSGVVSPPFVPELKISAVIKFCCGLRPIR